VRGGEREVDRGRREEGRRSGEAGGTRGANRKVKGVGGWRRDAKINLGSAGASSGEDK